VDYAEELKLPQVTGQFTDNKLSPKAINFVLFDIISSDKPSANSKLMVMGYKEQPWQVPLEITEVV
jgi:hypothetical protein